MDHQQTQQRRNLLLALMGFLTVFTRALGDWDLILVKRIQIRGGGGLGPFPFRCEQDHIYLQIIHPLRQRTCCGIPECMALVDPV